MIVFDASTVVAAALNPNGIPRRALVHARTHDRLAMSEPVAAEIREVIRRPKFAGLLTPSRQAEIVGLLFTDVDWFVPQVNVTDCRDPKDNKYLELALVAGASTIVSSDYDLLTLDPWRCVRVLRATEYLAHVQAT